MTGDLALLPQPDQGGQSPRWEGSLHYRQDAWFQCTRPVIVWMVDDYVMLSSLCRGREALHR